MADPFLDVLRDYFRGERLEAAAFIVPLGVASLAFAIVVLREERSAFSWSVAAPFLVLGLALLVAGASVALRTPGQVSALGALYDRDAATFVAQELPRMQKVNANWPIYVTTWAILVVIGLGLRFLVRREWALGLGIALIFFGGVGFMIDGFAERRARPYTRALEQLATSARPPS